jgi:hypothetical protein
MNKKLLSGFALAAVFMASCSKKSNEPIVANNNNEAPIAAHRGCASQEVLEEQMKADPTLRQKMVDLENFTDQVIANPARLVNGVIEIPVVVNVVYKTTAQNISATQINSQIDVLNKDFNALNTDYASVPSLFAGVKANVGIRFVLDQVRRKQTTKTSFSTNDAVKKTAQGGLDALTPTTKLNLWVCNLSNGTLGYAQFPGGASATDGVVITFSGFGTSGTAAAPFNKGRTATHEVGHWLNLRHIWGDATCGSDLVSDTPAHNGPNYGCPSFPRASTCSGAPTMMTMNYMDYTDDACMYMFSVGQKNRMNATFASGGPRNSFAQP